MKRSPPSSRQRGSTLIDICAACVTGSVTMALALPSYQSYLERTRRGEMNDFNARISALDYAWYLEQV